MQGEGGSSNGQGYNGDTNQSSWYSETRDTGSSNKRPFPESGNDRSSGKQRSTAESTSPKGGGNQGEPGARRAAQACLRCRKQKLRCLGGWPCKRCQKSKNVCDFGRTAPGTYLAATAPEPSTSTAANSRLEQLESSVANLLAGLAGTGTTVGQNGYSEEVLHMLNPTAARTTSFSSTDGRPFQSQALPSHIPPPMHTRPLDPPRLSSTSIMSGISPDESNRMRLQQQFSTSPNNFTLVGANQSPGYSASVFDQSPSSVQTMKPDHHTPTDHNKPPAAERRLGKGQKAEERLAAATEGNYEPPFKALVYQPAVWDNREQSRRTSPQPSGSVSREGSYNEYGLSLALERRFGHGRDKDDPINTGLIDVSMAETLFTFFIEHCHPFLPIVNVSVPFSTIRQSPPLICAMIAVAGRFYGRYTARSSKAYPPLDSSLPMKLANLAEAHLALTLLRKQHALSDVQAVLLLAAWGLQPGGKGPDGWIVTGHAARIARRLGVHKVLASAAEMARVTQPGSEDWQKLEAFLPQWRTWLCWFCFDGFLSLGFGRPQSTQFETVDEQGFLQLRLNQPLPRPGSTPSISLYGDVYIAGQVQLSQIGRDLINWAEVSADPKKIEAVDPVRDYSLTNMFRELNTRLDDWSRLWVWNGSPYALYLGSSARITRLQAEHLRLCLNSFALKSGPEENEMIAGYLKKALNAAMSTIQTHYESSQTDLALSFATDYLTITLAQAAVFLIRINKVSAPLQRIVAVDPSVVKHYLTMSIDLLESADLSETRVSTYLAKTIRDISRAAGITGIGTVTYDDPDAVDSRPHTAVSYPPPLAEDDPNADPNPFDLESFLQFDSQLDLGYLLGLPGDNSATSMSSTSSLGNLGNLGNMDDVGYSGEFGFGLGSLSGMNGMSGMGGMNGMSGLDGLGNMGMGDGMN